VNALKVCFAKPTATFVPLAWTIELIEWAPFSHTSFRYAAESGASSVFQITTTTPAAQIPLLDFLKQYKIVEEYTFSLTDDQFKKFLSFRDRNVGKAYSDWQLTGLGLVKLFSLKTNPLAQAGRATCSQLLLQCMQEQPEVFVGVDKIKKDITTVDLKLLRNFIASNPNAKRTV
jgi:hypothetical protein